MVLEFVDEQTLIGGLIRLTTLQFGTFYWLCIGPLAHSTLWNDSMLRMLMVARLVPEPLGTSTYRRQ